MKRPEEQSGPPKDADDGLAQKVERISSKLDLLVKRADLVHKSLLIVVILFGGYQIFFKYFYYREIFPKASICLTPYILKDIGNGPSVLVKVGITNNGNQKLEVKKLRVTLRRLRPISDRLLQAHLNAAERGESYPGDFPEIASIERKFDGKPELLMIEPAQYDTEMFYFLNVSLPEYFEIHAEIPKPDSKKSKLAWRETILLEGAAENDLSGSCKS